ncbi:MAG: hypothetical protein HY332_09215 [Chloroflexi bacterium]|nr:hypothetical protein [Chloroflexota bacterium]
MFLTAAEVDRELGIRKSRVYELGAGGLLPVVRLGRRMLRSQIPLFVAFGAATLLLLGLAALLAALRGRSGRGERGAASWAEWD